MCRTLNSAAVCPGSKKHCAIEVPSPAGILLKNERCEEPERAADQNGPFALRLSGEWRVTSGETEQRAPPPVVFVKSAEAIDGKRIGNAPGCKRVRNSMKVKGLNGDTVLGES